MRELRALIKKSLGSKAEKGSEVSIVVAVATALFGMLLLVVLFGNGIRRWFPNYSHNPNNIVVVNAPDSWKSFSETIEPKNADNWNTLFGYKFTYYNHEYVYDVAQFNRWMADNNSSLCIVFDGNDILTYYPADSLTYSDNKDYFKEVLNDYGNYLIYNENIPQYGDNAMKIQDEDFFRLENDKSDYVAVCYMLIPIVYFIAILYSAMGKGTYLVSGAKEQGTFSTILMTPVSRRDIVIGFSLGIWIKSLIPITVITVPVALFAIYNMGLSVLPFVFVALVNLLSLSLFISVLIVMISTMNSTVVSAQTTFLPVFFLFIALCVTVMQDPGKYDGIYHYIPFYGQYLGIAEALFEKASLLSVISTTITTLLFSGLIIWITVKMLYSERFTVESNSASNKELLKAQREIARQKNDYVAKPKISIFGYHPKKRMDHGSFITSQVFRPLVILSVFQLLSLVPPILMTSGSGLTEIMYALKEVNTVPGVIKVSANIMSVIMSSPLFMLSMGIGYILMIIVYCFRVKILEKDSIATMGFGYKKIALRYIAGLLLGIVMISLVYLLLMVTGQIEITGFGISSDKLILFFAYISMWIPQGATEEIMFRGYMMPRVASRYGLIPAIAVSSILFCIFHGMNPGFSVLALINLILISVLYALIAYYMDNIWTLCACHTMWNFTQGNVFGLEVSGNAGNATLIHTAFKTGASDLWTGGGFGPEGGLAVTIIVVICIGLVVLFRDKLRKTRKL